MNVSFENQKSNVAAAAMGMTTSPVKPHNSSSVMPEFGRAHDVQRIFGIKRGTLYNLLAEGRIKSVILRRRGNVHGCRLFHLASISSFLHALMQAQDPEEPVNHEVEHATPLPVHGSTNRSNFDVGRDASQHRSINQRPPCQFDAPVTVNKSIYNEMERR